MNACLGQRPSHVKMMTGWVGDHRRLRAKLQCFVQACNATINVRVLHIQAVSMPQHGNLRAREKLSNKPRMARTDAPETNNQKTFKHEINKRCGRLL